MYWVTAVLGLTSILAPFILGYSNDIGALWTSMTIGLILMTASSFEWAAKDREAWEYWVAGVTGVVAVFSPFLLGFSGVTIAVWTLVTIGLVTVMAAGIKLFPKQQF
jgi:hypothetical protein